MRQGYRVSLLPAINLCQMSELSIVLLALGNKSGDVSDNIIGIAAFSFALLAVDSTYAIFKNDSILQKATPWLNKMASAISTGRCPPTTPARSQNASVCWDFRGRPVRCSRKSAANAPICSRKSSSWISTRMSMKNSASAALRVVYGDITQRDMLHHAGVSHAEVIICSLPNMVLKGADNLKMLRQLRDLNPDAKIVVHAELLSDIPSCMLPARITSPRRAWSKPPTCFMPSRRPKKTCSTKNARSRKTN